MKCLLKPVPLVKTGMQHFTYYSLVLLLLVTFVKSYGYKFSLFLEELEV